MTNSSRNIKIIFPKPVQFYQWFCHMTYIAVAVYSVNIYRNISYYYISLIVVGLLEVAINYYRSKIIKLPITCFISTGAVFMLVESSHLQVYLLGGTIAVLSKYFLQVNGRHVFNPGNIGTLAVILLLPIYAVSVPSQWGGGTSFIILMATLGLVATVWAKRAWITFSYIIAFSLFSYARAYAYNLSPAFLIGTLIGAPSVLFAFHMINDPATTPENRRHQIYFGAIVAGSDFVLRWLQIIYAPLIALAIVSSVWPLLNIKGKKEIKFANN